MNNLVFSKLIALFNLGHHDELIQQCFEIGGNPLPVSKSKIRAWRNTNIDDRRYSSMPDMALAVFLIGLQELSKQGVLKIEITPA